MAATLMTEPLLHGTTQASTFQSVTPGYRFVFPADHGAHEAFRTEWWYYTGHLTSQSGRRLGYQITFFRRGLDHAAARSNPSAWAIRHLYLAHLAVSDLDQHRFRYAEKISRAGLGKAGATPRRLSVWIDRWAVTMSQESERQEIKADGPDFTVELILVPQKPPVIHGDRGVSRKGDGREDASYYYSMTRLRTHGTVRLGAEQLVVDGTSWMDHEFGSGDLSDDLVGWDWFSMQLSDGRDLMLYLLRRRDGSTHAASSGTLIDASGGSVTLHSADFSVEVLDHWTSPQSHSRYPSRWRIVVPRLSVKLEIVPLSADQELRTARSTQVTYWEGAVRVMAAEDHRPSLGQGYVELTGYAEPLRQPK